MKPEIKLLGIGTARPRYSMDQMEAAEMVKNFAVDSPDRNRLVPLIYQKSSVQQRGLIVLEKIGHAFKPDKVFSKMKDSEDQGPTTEERMKIYKREASNLAFEASRNAMAQARIKPNDIDHLVTVSCTGFSAPGFDIDLMKQLDLRRTVSRTHIGFMGCHGAFNGFRVAQALASQKSSSVLLAAVELCSIHFAYGSDPSQIVANSLFADGASSAVISSREADQPCWKLAASGSYLFSDSEHLMKWDIGNHGFRMHLSPEIPRMIENHLKNYVIEWLNDQNLNLSDIRSWAVHPGGPRILSAVESALHLTPNSLDVSRRILTNYGNMSSATILYIVDELIKKSYKTPCVALGFGPGLHLEIALFI